MSISPEVRDKIERECNALARAERGRRLVQMIRAKRSNGWLVIRSNLTGKRSNADEFQGSVLIGDPMLLPDIAWDDTWAELYESQSRLPHEAHVVPDVMLLNSDTSTASYPKEELPKVSVVVVPKLATPQDFGIREEPRKRKTQRRTTHTTVKK